MVFMNMLEEENAKTRPVTKESEMEVDIEEEVEEEKMRSSG